MKSTESPSVTVTDVAKAAGVGVGTVSRVINHSSAVRSETAERVHQAIARLRYQAPLPGHRRGPRVGTARPSKQAGGVLMLILGSYGIKWVLDCAPVYSYVFHGIEAGVTAKGHGLTVRQAANWTAAAEAIAQAKFDGVVILGVEPEGEMPSSLREIPCVWVMGGPWHFIGDHVHPDHGRTGRLAADYLLSQGHRHVAYLDRTVTHPAESSRPRGELFRLTIENAGGHVEMLTDPNLVISTPQQNAPDEALLARLLDRMIDAKPRPTALLLAADMFAPGVYRHLTKRGIRPQVDVSIVTCNNERAYLAGLQPVPSIIDLRAEAIGRRAVDQLFWRARNRAEPPMRTMIEPLLLPAPALTLQANGTSSTD